MTPAPTLVPSNEGAGVTSMVTTSRFDEVVSPSRHILPMSLREDTGTMLGPNGA